MKLDQESPDPYESPEIVDYGDLVELTAGQASAHHLDSVFHAGATNEHPDFSSA